MYNKIDNFCGHFSEELIVDNSVHSDLDPLEAPEWSISIAMQVNQIYSQSLHTWFFLSFFIVLFQENVSACQANSSFWFWNKNADWFVKSFSSCKVVFSNTLINQTLLKKISQYYIVFWIWRILLGQKRPNCRWLDIYLVKY